MKNEVRILIALLFGVAAAPLTGCANNSGRQEVSGTVKLKGAALNEGVIEFFPQSAEATTKSGAMIADGKYLVPRESGLVPGKYRVSITAGDGRTRANANPEEPPGPTGANIVSKDRIPPEYNVNSKQEIEVKQGGPNVFDYDIP